MTLVSSCTISLFNRSQLLDMHSLARPINTLLRKSREQQDRTFECRQINSNSDTKCPRHRTLYSLLKLRHLYPLTSPLLRRCFLRCH